MSAVSLVQGWLPVTVQLVALLVLGLALVRRGRRWWTLWVPVLIGVGVVAALVVQRVATDQGVVNDPPPVTLWLWAGTTVAAAVLAVVGWRGARWWRRVAAIAAVPLAALCIGVVMNQWVAYWVTVQGAWGQISNAPLPDQVDPSVLAAHVRAPLRRGAVVPVDVPDTNSGFSHRTEYVYLPPAWFVTGTDRTRLPVVMMIGAEYSTASDWPRVGNAVVTADRFAAEHGGMAPVLVFPDASGSIENDTECVNGPRGRAADHLTEDVRPYVVQNFGVSDAPSRWAVTGFSTGGVCALDLVVMHPDRFGTFDDIEGDLAPTVGDKEQTIDRLFGGDRAAYDAFDPAVVMARHGPYTGVAGRFDESNGRNPTGAAVPAAQGLAAVRLCDDARAVAVDCTVEAVPGGHNWVFGAVAFARSLPWLFDRLSQPPPV